MPLPDAPYHPPRPRGRPPLGDRQRSRLTIKLPGASKGSAAADAKPEIEEAEAQLEEQFIIRVLPEMAATFGKQVNERTISDNLEIKFRDERNAIVKFDKKLYSAKLMDMPTITESYRTLDKKQLLKTADICQMLLVEKEVNEGDINSLPLARGMDVIHPDGLSVPLTNARKRRFRPRIPQTKVDQIEKEVLRLLEEDAQAMAVKYEIYDDQLDEDGDGGAATPSIDIMSPVTLDDITTPMVNDEDAASSVANEDMEFDENLAAELAQGLEELEEDDEDEDESEESEDEDQPNNERAMQMKLLGEEIAEIERTIKKKRVDLDSAPNPIIRRRFEDIIQRLQSELDAKKEQLAQFHKETEEEQQQHQQQQQQHQQEEGDGSNQ